MTNTAKISTTTNQKRFLTSEDVSAILGISRSASYRIIKTLNDQLKARNKIVIAGKISSTYFYENVYL